MGRASSHFVTAVFFSLLGAVLIGIPTAAFADEQSFTAFESGQVRPLALSPDGSLLFACNTPDARLEVYAVGVGTLTHVGGVGVGLEPVAVAARTNSEVWVVNHLSDSVSIVDVSTPAAPRVERTLLVGDEPRDIVFAGPAGNRAFITTAHRGQNTPLQPTIIAEMRAEGIGRADVWVFDATALGTSMGGDELTIVQLFGDTPRALAVSPDGNTVYAAVFHSGNQTTTLSEGVISNNGGLPPPLVNHSGAGAPNVGLIVKYDGAAWVDELSRDWTSFVRFDLPDHDVFAIDATANPPVQIGGASGFWPSVGTVLFNMVTNPVSGKVYVSNTEAINEVRFEGPGAFASTTVRGHLHESRITVLDGTNVIPRHLNKHIDYSTCCAPIPNAENANSLAFPLDMAVSSDGATLYVSGFGSNEVGILDTAQLEANTFVPDAADQVGLSGGGPTGLVLDEARAQLYVLTRFDNSISIINTTTEAETLHVPMYNPEPASIVNGRPFLYDTSFSSSHGDSSCASCHVFADFDSLAWDLGDPDGDILNNPSPFTLGPIGDPDFHPMKGPMTTQSLRGMANHGPMHWRGDRTGGNDAGNSQPDGGTFDEDAGFKKFNGAFVGLLGRTVELTTPEMQAFTDFILQVTYPPNPIRALDNSLTAEEQAGENFYFGPISDTFFDCNGCHVLDPNGNAGFGVDKPGFFGTDGRSSFENEPQHFKIAHLRNMYQKVGMFGMADVPFFNSSDDNTHQGDQVRGFGFLHDGSTDTLFRFHGADVFDVTDQQRRELEAFMLVFDSNLAPIVGQQITRNATNAAAVDARIDLLIARDDAGECDLIAKGVLAGEARGWLYIGAGQFSSDRVFAPSTGTAALKAQGDVAGQEVTFTCVPPANGTRLGVDRDEDGFRDRDELDAGSDPADPSSTPAPSCGDGTVDPGEDCDDAGESATCDIDCTSVSCGDGTTNTTAGEACDDAGESAICNADCSLAACGDGLINASAGEQCDDSGESATCDVNCTIVICGDGTHNATAGEACDDGGESATCDTNCTLAVCGDGTINATAGEDCDDSGETATCDINCTSVSCGDGTLNTTAGESCDDGGESATCDSDCSPAACGDGTTNATAGEDCDDSGESATCDADCSSATCGDGTLNPTAGESCDDAGESAICDVDCTPVACGDGTPNAAAGEDCDDAGESPTCDADCSAVLCGDTTINVTAGEDCEGGDLNGADCGSLGFGTGTLLCTGACVFDPSGCSGAPVCGNGVTESGEDCDDSGESAVCDADCTAAACGDGTINATAGEDCDDSGESAACNADCTASVCGDGTTNATAGETCDDGGESASCDADCSAVSCGDATVNGSAGEQCDGANLGGADCVSQGFGSGTLACDGSCLLDTSACVPAPRVFEARQFKFARLNKPAGEHKVVIKSYDMDGVGVIFNPLGDGLTVAISASGGTVWEGVIGPNDPGWKLRKDKLRWKPTTLANATGLKAVRIGISGFPFQFRAKAKLTTVTGAVGEASLDLSLDVSGAVYAGSLPCETSGSAAVVKCR